MLFSLRVYFLLLRGWASNSQFAVVGALRGVAQVISFEARLAFAFIGRVVLAKPGKDQEFDGGSRKERLFS